MGTMTLQNLTEQLQRFSETNRILHEKLRQEILSREKLQESVAKITQNYLIALKNNRDRQCAQCENLKSLLSQSEQRIFELEEENRSLSNELRDCEDYIESQVSQMKKISSYIDSLTEDLEDRPSRRKLKVPTIGSHLEHRPDSSNRIQELESTLNKYEINLAKNEEKNKALQEMLENEKDSKQKLEQAFSKTAEIYEDLLKKNQGFEELKYQYQTLKAKYEGLWDQCEDLKEKAQRVGKLEEEQQACHCHMRNQDNQINHLLKNLEDLSRKNDDMKMTILDMEAHIDESNSKLDNIQKERNFLRSRVQVLESRLKDYESTMALKDENNRILLQNLEVEKTAKRNLEAAFSAVTQSETQLKELLNQAREAIKLITQKIEEDDIERLETQRDKEIKITELEEQLMIANATIKKLRNNLDQMKKVMDKNVTLRSLSSQLHNAANCQVTKLQESNNDLSKRSQKMAEMYNYLKQVLYEKDKTFEDLRNQLLFLRQRLDNEQKLRQDAGTALSDPEKSRLLEEIELLQAEVENLRNSPVGRLKSRVAELENGNIFLKNELSKCRKYLQDVLPGYVDPAELANLEKQLQDLTREVEDQKKKRMETVAQMEAKMKKRDEEFERLKELMAQVQRKGKLVEKPKSTVIFLEKINKDDGGVEYRYLYSLVDDKTKVVEAKLLKEDPQRVGIEAKRSDGVSSGQDALRIKELEKQLKAAGEEINKLKSISERKSVSTDGARINDLEKELEDATEKINRLRNLLATEGFLEDKPSFSDRTRIKELEQQLEAATQEIVSLKQSVPKESQHISTDGVRIKELEHQLESATREIFRLKQVVINQAPLHSVNVRQNEAEEHLAEANKEIIRLKNVLAAFEGKFAEMEKRSMMDAEKIKDLGAKLSTANNEIEALRRKRKDMPVQETSQIANFEEAREDLSKQINNQTKEIADLINKIMVSSANHPISDEVKRSENEKLKATIRDLEEEVQNLRNFKNQPSSIQELRKSLETEQNRTKELKEFLRNCDNEKNKLKSQNDELWSENKQLIEEVARVKERERQPRLSVDFEAQMKKVDSSLKAWHDELSHAVDKVKDEIEGFTIGMQDSPSRTESVLQRLTEEVERLKKELLEHVNKKKVVVATEVQDRHIEELENQLIQANEMNVKLTEEIEDLKREMAVIKKDVTVEPTAAPRHLEVQNLEKQLEESEDKNKKLKKELDTLREERFSNPIHLGKDGKDETEELKLCQESDRSKEQMCWSKSRDSFRFSSSLDFLGDKDKRILELEDKIIQWQNDYDEEVQKLRKEIGNLLARGGLPEGCEAHEVIVKELQASLINYQKQNEILENRNNQLESENERLLKTLVKPDGDDASVSSEVEEKRVRELIEHLKELQQKNDTLKSRTIHLELENGRLKNDLERIVGKGHTSLEKELQKMRSLERNLKRLDEKYHALKKRSMKLEIENGNLKKEYINTLIAKEKLALQNREQTKRLRETNKLLRKCNDKKNNLTMRMIKLQVDSETMQPPTATLSKVDSQHENVAQVDLEELLVSHKFSDHSMDGEEHPVKQQERKEDVKSLKEKIGRLEMEVVLLRRELDSSRLKEVSSTESVEKPSSSDTNQKTQMKIVQLEIENEYLKSELTNKEQICVEAGSTEKKISELEEEINKLNQMNEKLKVMNVELELDNEYMKSEIDRISKVQQSLALDAPDKNLEKQNHLLKMKNDNLEVENKNLKSQIDVLGKEKISLMSHVQEKKLKEMERIVRAFQNMKESRIKLAENQEDNLEVVERRLDEWRDQFLPQILDLKKEVDRLRGKDTVSSDDQLREYRNKLADLELENRNLKVELEIINQSADLDKKELMKEIQRQIAQYPMAAPSKFECADLEKRLKDLESLNEMLKNETIELEKHVQDKKIKDLEAQLQDYDPSRFEGPRSRREKKSLIIDVQDLKVADLEKKVDTDERVIENMKAELEFLRNEKAKLDVDLANFKSANQDLSTELQRFRKIYELQQKLTHDLNNQLEQCRKQNDKLQQNADKTANNKHKSFPLLKKSSSQVQREFLEMKQRIADLEASLEKCRDVNKDLKKRLKTAEEKYEKEKKKQKEDKKDDEQWYDVQEDKESQLKEVDQLKSQLEVSRSDNIVLKQRLEELRDENVRLQIRRVVKLEESRSKLMTEEEEVREIEKELIEIWSRSEMVKVEFEAFRRELAYSQEQSEDSNIDVLKEDNKKLKDELNRRTKERDEAWEDNNKLKDDLKMAEEQNENLNNQIVLLKEDNKKLKDELNRRTRERDEDNEKLKDELNRLTMNSEDQKKEIGELRQKIQNLGGGEYYALHQELANRQDENKKLRLLVDDLERQMENLTKVGRGDTDEKRRRKLEETLQKYHDNNEFLKIKISQLESEKASLNLELHDYVEKEKRVSPVQIRRIRKLEEIMKKYRDKSLELARLGEKKEVSTMTRDEKSDKVFQQQPLMMCTMPILVQPNAEDRLSSLVEKIQNSLDERKKGKSRETQTCPKSQNSRFSSNCAASDESILGHVTRDKMESLHNTVRETIAWLEKEVKLQRQRKQQSSQDKKKPSSPNSVQKFKNIISKCPMSADPISSRSGDKTSRPNQSKFGSKNSDSKK